ncbi:MAG: hypothetical protein LBV38_03945 [Alistipes sp.]|jgi:predicted Zn-dependent protease|nr:hypothetical protein [Alistipes sp.]
MQKYLLLAAAALFSIFTTSVAARQNPPQQSPLQQLLKTELEYTFDQLSEEENPPYYINFRTTDTHRRTATASFGTLTNASDTRERLFKPHIRLGSPEFDNFHDGTIRYGGGTLLPISDTLPEALRQSIWQSVEREYRDASARLERLKADEHLSTARDDRAPDWSPAPAESYHEAPENPETNPRTTTETLKQKVKLYSAAFQNTPELLSGTASIDFTTRRHLLVDTDGDPATPDTSIARNSTACRLMISASVRTSDGMDLPLHRSWFAFTPDGLPTDAEVIQEAKNLAETLTKMTQAPVVTPYTGPALLSGEAAGVFFHEIFGHRIEGQRMKSDADGQTFKQMIGRAVLPRHFSVYDDPTLKTFDGADLYGHYLFDDQGVKARRVDVVKNGVLNEFLMTRTPTDEFASSNGHARAEGGLDPVSRQSNLVVTTDRPLTDEQLRKALIREAKRQHRDFGLYFKEVTGGFTQTGRYTPASFNVTPLEVYRIYVDGRPDELVRGVDLIGTPLSMFAGIMEAGGATEIFTGVCGAESGSVPVTAISPAVLVGKVEVQRQPKSPDTQPLLPRPSADAPASAEADKIFAAMNAELQRSMSQLTMDGAPKPLWLGYLHSDVRAMVVTATLGGVVTTRLQPQRFGGVRLLLGDAMATSDLSHDGSYDIRGAATETDAGQIRREFWAATDAAYKQAAADLVRKLAIRRQSTRPADEEQLPDLVPVAAVEHIAKSPRFELDRAEWERRAAQLSAIFARHPSLYGSEVRVTAYDWTNRLLTSEGVRVRVPVSFASVSVSASVRSADGLEYSDGIDIFAPSDLSLPSADSLAARVEEFASRLEGHARASRFEGFYSGPVLFVGQGVFSIFDDNLLSNDGNGLLVERRPEAGYNAPSPRRLENRLGQRILDRRFRVVNRSSLGVWGDTPLLGRYPIDADGVTPPDSLVLVTDGMLAATLSGNIPTPRSRASTGSNRFSVNVNPYIAPGVLDISARGGSSTQELEDQLLALAAADGLDHAYIVERIGGVNLVWRVDVATGARTPVRDADITPVALSALRRVAGVSNRSEVRNYLAGQVPASMIHPTALLLENVEIAAIESTGEQPLQLINPLERID